MRDADFIPLLTFVEASAKAGLNPSRDFRHADLSGVDFTGSDLSGHDFTGADLRGSYGLNVTLAPSTIIDGASVAGSMFSSLATERRIATNRYALRRLESLREDSVERATFLQRSLGDESHEDFDIARLLLNEQESSFTIISAFYGMLGRSEQAIQEVILDVFARRLHNTTLVANWLRAICRRQLRETLIELITGLLLDDRPEIGLESLRALSHQSDLDPAQQKEIVRRVHDPRFRAVRHKIAFSASSGVCFEYKDARSGQTFGWLPSPGRAISKSLMDQVEPVRVIEQRLEGSGNRSRIALRREPLLATRGSGIRPGQQAVSRYLATVFYEKGLAFMLEDSMRWPSDVRDKIKDKDRETGLARPKDEIVKPDDISQTLKWFRRAVLKDGRRHRADQFDTEVPLYGTTVCESELVRLADL